MLNMRDMNSSVIAGMNPMRSTVVHGKRVLSRSSYLTSIGAHAPSLPATM